MDNDNLLDILKSNGDLNDVHNYDIEELSLDKDKQYIITLRGQKDAFGRQARILADSILKDLPRGSYVFTDTNNSVRIEEGKLANITFTIDKDDKVVDSEGKEYFSNIPLAVAELLNIVRVEGRYRLLLIKEE